MKNVTLLLLSLGLSLSAKAESCNSRLLNSNWPEDKLIYSYSCQLKQTTLGNSDYSYSNLCFGLVKTDIVGKEVMMYKIFRFNTGEAGGLLSILSYTGHPEGPTREGSVDIDGSILTASVKRSGLTQASAVEELKLDLQNPGPTQFNTYEKSLFSKSLKQAELYNCAREQN